VLLSEQAELPKQPPVTLHWLRVGHCRQLEALARRGGPWRPVDFPSYVGAIRHPDAGWVLFDTGYADHFLAATNPFPERLYRWLLPVRLPATEQLTAQLGRLGVEPGDVTRVVVSHFHGDHISGLRDFPAARVSASREGLRQMATTGRWSGTRLGLLPALLPDDVNARFDPVDDLPPVPVGPFTGRDLLGDGKLLAVELPGHLAGHLGLLLTTDRGPVLLAGDAAWSLRAIREDTPPARVVVRGLHDPDALLETLHRLHELALARPELTMLPSHCPEAAEGWHGAGG
jgi:glyoxylase-like metal-dependent hydrolase (beta-lactamase superfamily II)